MPMESIEFDINLGDTLDPVMELESEDPDLFLSNDDLALNHEELSTTNDFLIDIDLDDKTHKRGVLSDLSFYMRIIDRFPIPNKEQQLEMARKAHSGDQYAFEWMFKHNLRLVIGPARRCAISKHMDIMDVISHGNLGLYRAVQKFDPEMGYQFSTYANYWIKQAVFRAISAEGTIVKCPYQLLVLSWKKSRIDKEANASGEHISENELKRRLDISDEKYDSLLFFQNQRHLAFDTPSAADSDKSIADTLADDRDDIHSFIDDHDYKRVSSVLLERLNEKQAKVISLRFGLNGGPEMTLSEIGKVLGVTRERARQIEHEAFRLMKAYSSRINFGSDIF